MSDHQSMYVTYFTPQAVCSYSLKYNKNEGQGATHMLAVFQLMLFI